MSDVPLADTIDLRGKAGEVLQSTLLELGLHLSEKDVARLLAGLGRQPTRAELALVDVMWSEHCSYKSTRALLRRLPTTGPHVVVGPGADAGVVRVPRVANGRVDPGGGTRCVAIAHESHNHPSQLLPFEGASTGIGGIVRDVYCMGADVIGVLDALRFGDVAGENAESVRQIVRGVVDGIAHYGNALGVPNLGGEVEFDSEFDDNCLVNVVAFGVLDADAIIPSRAPEIAGHEGWVLLLVGKPTDDSGLGGAAFASVILDTHEDTQERGAVQLPDPFFKRVLTEANREAVATLRRAGVPFAMKDLGAAGLGGASSEMAGSLGLELDLDALHADRPDRPAAVLLVAETQERYAFAVPESVVEPLRHIYEQTFELGAMVRGAGARVVGRFDTSGRFRVRARGAVHVDLATAAITELESVDWPRAAPRVSQGVSHTLREGVGTRDLESDLIAVLRSAGGGSRRPLFGHFDSDVQGRTMLRPGDADAGVVVPWRDASVGLALAVGGPARLGRRDPWRAGAASVCEAARNVTAVGAMPWALTDCLNFGSPENPECMRDLEESVRGLAEAARALALYEHPDVALPFVSGNVSLYNESRAGRAIPPTPIVACLGVLPDYAECRGMALRHAGDVLVFVGSASECLGGTLYAEATAQDVLGHNDELGALDLEAQRRQIAALLDAFRAGIVRACHDVGAGGLIVTLVEMCVGRTGPVTHGVRCTLPATTQLPVAALFSEPPGFVCAVRPDHVERFTALCSARGAPVQRLGVVVENPELHVECGDRSWRLQLQPLAAVWLHALDSIVHEEVRA